MDTKLLEYNKIPVLRILCEDLGRRNVTEWIINQSAEHVIYCLTFNIENQGL